MQQGFSCDKWFVGNGMRNLLISQNGQSMFELTVLEMVYACGFL